MLPFLRLLCLFSLIVPSLCSTDSSVEKEGRGVQGNAKIGVSNVNPPTDVDKNMPMSLLLSKTPSSIHLRGSRLLKSKHITIDLPDTWEDVDLVDLITHHRTGGALGSPLRTLQYFCSVSAVAVAVDELDTPRWGPCNPELWRTMLCRPTIQRIACPPGTKVQHRRKDTRVAICCGPCAVLNAAVATIKIVVTSVVVSVSMKCAVHDEMFIYHEC